MARVLFSVLNFVISIALIVNTGVSAASIAYTDAALSDQVHSLPDAASPLASNQFSGFLNVSSSRFIHYYYFESERDPSVDKVVFWTNGGPGCSGLLGLFSEFGPWRPMDDGSLVRNPYAWTQAASLVFLEQPVGVGFSHSTEPVTLNTYNDFMASKDNLQVIKEFFRRFPERAQQGFYLASESYGGHFIPQWTLQVLNDADVRSHFKGFLLGNPYVSYASGSVAMANVLWGLQLLPKNEWDLFTEYSCDSMDNDAYKFERSLPQCFSMIDQMFGHISHLNPYSLQFPVCNRNDGATTYTDGAIGADPATSSPKNGAGSRDNSSGLDSGRQPLQRQSSFLRYAGDTLGGESQEFLSSIRYVGAQQKALLRHWHRIASQGTVGSTGTSISASSTYDARSSTSTSTSIGSGHSNGKGVGELDGQEADYSKGSSHGSNHELSSRQVRKMDSAFRYEPCVEDDTVAYLNRPDVQAALNVDKVYEVPEITDDVLEYLYTYWYSPEEQDAEKDEEAGKNAPGSTYDQLKRNRHSAMEGGSDSGSGTSLQDEKVEDVSQTHTWDFCSDYVNYFWSQPDVLGDTTELYKEIVAHPHKPKGFKMLIYSGDIDGVCATVGTQSWIYNVTGLDSVTNLHRPWYYEDEVYGTQLGGYLTQFKGSLSFMTVRYAGHEVPAYQPQKALELFNGYLDGSIFDTAEAETGDTNGGGDSGNGEGEEELLEQDLTSIVIAILLVLAAAVGIILFFRGEIHKWWTGDGSGGTDSAGVGSTCRRGDMVVNPMLDQQRGGVSGDSMAEVGTGKNLSRDNIDDFRQGRISHGGDSQRLSQPKARAAQLQSSTVRGTRSDSRRGPGAYEDTDDDGGSDGNDGFRDDHML